MSQDGVGDDMDRRGERLGALLRATDAPVPAMAFPAERVARARRRRALRRGLIATIAVLASAAAAVPPVRALITGAARQLWSSAVGRDAASSASPVPRSPSPVPANAVSFAPEGSVFVVEIATRQAEGALRLERSGDTTARAALVGDPTAAGLVVLPGGLRIINGSRAKADYLVELPDRVERVEVRLGREPPRVVEVGSGGARIPLGAASEAGRAKRL